MMYGGGYGFVGMWIGMLIMVLLLVGLAFLVVWVVRRTSSGGNGGFPASGPATPHTAKDILEMRYARGEITREQYLQMKQDLNQ